MNDELLNQTNKLYDEVSRTASAGNFPHGVLVECQNEEDGINFAHYIAQCLVCTEKQKPCGKCVHCLKTEKRGHPDIFETDGIKEKSKSKNFTVDAVRNIRQDAFVVPNEAESKVYILKNGQNMNEQAQNAILKILEEPPSNVYFIIITASKSTMLETVLSRVCVYSLSDGESKISEKERDCVENFITALLCTDELKLMEQTSLFQKDSPFARKVLMLLSEVFRDALVQKSGFKGDFRFQKETDLLCSRLTAKSLLNLQNVCSELVSSIERNCNNNLLVVRMCYEFKRAIGR